MREHYDVLIVGAGPAGLAAARAAASHGARVGLLDAQAHAGGQVWRRDVMQAAPGKARRHLQSSLRASQVDFLAQTSVVAAESGALLVEHPEGARWLTHDALIVAAGARELLLPFPGWTLPGVTGAGGLQALAKQGWPLAGKRVLVAGSGPLLLATAMTARRHGAQVLGICEHMSMRTLTRFTAGLWRWPGKLAQAATLRARLIDVSYRSGHIVTRALGDDHLRTVDIEGPRGRRQLDCDYLAVGHGLVPNVELAQLLGCAMHEGDAHPSVRVDAHQHTSIDGVFAAGETCGIGGRDCALIEGAIAGHAAVGARAEAAGLASRRRHARAFAAHLAQHFVLDARLRERIEPDTLVCRCEDVPWQSIEGHVDARSAKLASRCGMGACQGRICGSALAALGRFPHGGLRPPLFPVRLAALATASLSHAPASAVAPNAGSES